MYDFVDRPVDRLDAGGRFLLWAMRGWTEALGKGQCPPGALAPAFARHAVLPALPALHMLLTMLSRHATRRISLAPLRHRRIGDDEAVLLQLCRDATDHPPRARATLALLVNEEASGAAFSALLTTVARLGQGGLGRVGLGAAPMLDPR